MSIRLSEKYGLNPMVGQCPLCGGDSGGIYLLGRMPGDKEAPRKGALRGSPPCDTCKEYMKQGFLLIECTDDSYGDNPYRTGNLWVIKREAAENLGVDVSKGASFITQSVAKEIGLTVRHASEEVKDG